MSVWTTRAVLFGAALAVGACGGGSTDTHTTTTSAGTDTQLSGNTTPIPNSDGGNNSDTATNCDGTIKGCFDIAGLQISKYKYNKKAAASYTFDDGYPSSFTIADIFEKFNARATFYIVAGNVANEDWAKWKDLIQRGHEIGNHSMTHTVNMAQADVTDDVLETEINGSRRIIAEKLGLAKFTFAFPWHQYTDHALKMAMQNHFDVRKLSLADDPTYSFSFFDMEKDHHPDPNKAVADVNQQLENTVNAGGWFVAGGHGVDGDGWSPVTSQFLEDHLTFAGKFTSSLWIDTYLNVYRYRTCRSQVTPTLLVQSSTRAEISLSGQFDATLCTDPLTVALPSAASFLPAKVQARNEAGEYIPVKYSSGSLLINLRPGEKATVEVIQKSV